MAGKAKQGIEIGSTVKVEVVKRPTNASAVKTIRRVLAKDPETAAQKKKDKAFRARSVRVKQRGGRPWEGRPIMRQPVEGVVGDSGTVLATADVVNDLKSVERFVKVSPAA